MESGTSKTYTTWPCPHCGSFKQRDKHPLLVCEDCSETIRRSQYKIAIEYAQFVYRYGHLFRSVYETQLEKEATVAHVQVNDAHPVAIGATLVTLSALHGPDANWFLTKQTVRRFVASYNDTFDEEVMLEDSELKKMNKNIREFTQDFSEASPALRNAVFEEIFADHCPKKDHDTLIQLQIDLKNSAPEKRQQLQEAFDAIFQNVMAKTFKKVGKLPKPAPEELNSYWSKVLKMS